MADRPLDAELVAALLDDRLPAPERDRVLAQLAEDEHWREVMADASAVLPNARPVPSNSTARPTASTQRRWRPAWAAVAIAAVALFVLIRRAGIADSTETSGRETTLALLDVPEERSPIAGETLANRWSRTRGVSAITDDQSRAVRLGVLSVDLVARAAQPTAADFAGLRDEFLGYLEPVNGSAVVETAIQSAADRQGIINATVLARALVDTMAFDAGAWIERARLDAVNGADRATRQPTAAIVAVARSDSAASRMLSQLMRAGAMARRPLLDSVLGQLAR